jgi:hypothetical protein
LATAFDVTRSVKSSRLAHFRPDVRFERGLDDDDNVGSKFEWMAIGVLCGGTGGGGSGTMMSEFLGFGLVQSGSGIDFL